LAQLGFESFVEVDWESNGFRLQSLSGELLVNVAFVLSHLSTSAIACSALVDFGFDLLYEMRGSEGFEEVWPSVGGKQTCKMKANADVLRSSKRKSVFVCDSGRDYCS
jgi:hypothetical protein